MKPYIYSPLGVLCSLGYHIERSVKNRSQKYVLVHIIIAK